MAFPTFFHFNCQMGWYKSTIRRRLEYTASEIAKISHVRLDAKSVFLKESFATLLHLSFLFPQNYLKVKLSI